MASRLATPPAPGTASAEIVVWSETAIATVARMLSDAGAGAATVVDGHGDRAGVAMAQDVFEAARLGAGREPVSRIVIWSKSMPAAKKPRAQAPPLRLVRRSTNPRRSYDPVVSAPTMTAIDQPTSATDAPEPLRLVLSGDWR